MGIIFAVMVAAGASGRGGCKVEATRDIIKAQTDQLKVVGQRFDIGAVLITDVLTQESELANTEATLPALQKQLEQRGHLLLILTGRFPNQERADRITLATPKLPKDLPVILSIALRDPLKPLGIVVHHYVVVGRDGHVSMEHIKLI